MGITEKVCCHRCVAVSISRFNRTFCIGVRPNPPSLMSFVSKQSKSAEHRVLPSTRFSAKTLAASVKPMP